MHSYPRDTAMNLLRLETQKLYVIKVIVIYYQYPCGQINIIERN